MYFAMFGVDAYSERQKVYIRNKIYVWCGEVLNYHVAPGNDTVKTCGRSVPNFSPMPLASCPSP